MSPGARFRALLSDPPLLCLGAHDPVTAKLAEQAGANAVFVSGFASSAVIAGAPDLGVITQTEMFEHVRRICRATSLPVFADCDTGYGGPLEAQRTISLWEEAGAAALHVEDQVAPKRCGAFAGKEIIPIAEMQQKLRAMIEARRDPDFFIVARTDSFGVTSFDETIERMAAYAAIGADGLFVASPMTLKELEETARHLRPLGKPLLCLLSRSDRTPFISVKESVALGYTFMIAPVESLFAMHKAVTEVYRRILSERALDSIADKLTTIEEFNNFIGAGETMARQRRYGC
jgi:2-methylisocitrate lyase-like PEP mutase family enzyme